MSTFLFAVQPAMGHMNPMLTIARQMKLEGHSITFVCSAPAKTTEVITASGFSIAEIRPSLSTLGMLLIPFTSGYFETFMAIKLFTFGSYHYACVIGKVLDELKPDAVVADFTFPGACLAAEYRDIPYINIYHAGLCFKGDGIPPFGSGLPIGETWGRKGKFYNFTSTYLTTSINKSINNARKRMGLKQKESKGWEIFLSPWLTLVLTTEAAEAPRFSLPRNTFFIGSCFAGRQSNKKIDFSFDQLSKDKPKVYVSLGTVFNSKPKIFKKIINSFSDGRYQLIISAGKSFSKLYSKDIPPNILLFESVPQIEVLPKIDAVISHGGNNTINETLAAGKPLLVIPVGGEQTDNASRITYLGAGLRADISTITSQGIGGKVDEIIENKMFRERAEEISKAIAQTGGAKTATQFIEYVTKIKQPLFRPETYPLTVTQEIGVPWEYKIS